MGFGRSPCGVGYREGIDRATSDMPDVRTILLVDDEHTIRKLVSRSLQECGYEVLEAHCGRDAIELSEQHEGTIDLLLSDIVMPGGITGVELALLLKLSRPDMKVIFDVGERSDNACVGYRVAIYSKAIQTIHPHGEGKAHLGRGHHLGL